MNNKGFVISIDAMLALSVMLVLFIAAAFYLAQVKSSATPSLFLKEFSMDTGMVLEKTSLLKNAIEKNSSTELSSFLNKLPKNVCLEVSIFNKDNLESAEITVLKSGCNADYSEKTSIKRGFLAGSPPEFYIARISAWHG